VRCVGRPWSRLGYTGNAPCLMHWLKHTAACRNITPSPNKSTPTHCRQLNYPHKLRDRMGTAGGTTHRL